MKTYTTAELLEKLSYGQTAEMIQPVQDVVVKQTSSGLIVLKDAMTTKHIGQPLPLSLTVLNATWRLERQKLMFLEAVEYLKKGRKVSCVFDGRKPVIYETLDELVHIYEVVDGKWFLED
jgi:hypothetical protein